MKVGFIVNGKARKSAKIYSEIVEFEQSQIAEKVNTYTTEYRGHAIEIAKNCAQNHDLIIAVGGDGTCNEVVNGIMLSGKRCKMGILPFGTANDLSRTLGINNSLAQLIDLVDKNSFRKIDLAKATIHNEDADEVVRYIINVIDFGIGGYVVEKVSKSNKTFGAKISFLKAIFESILTYEQSTVKISADNMEWQGKLLSLALSNGKFFGSGIQIAPDASLDDGVLNGCIFTDISTKDYILHINKLRKGHKVNHKGVQYFQTKSLRIEPIELSCAIDIDGEFCGFAPASIEVMPNAIEILAPAVKPLDFC